MSHIHSWLIILRIVICLLWPVMLSLVVCIWTGRVKCCPVRSIPLRWKPFLIEKHEIFTNLCVADLHVQYMTRLRYSTRTDTQDVQPSRDHRVYNHGLFLALSSLPPIPSEPFLLIPFGHLYSSTFIYCHPASATDCSELPSHLTSCSATFPPSLSSVPHFCLPSQPISSHHGRLRARQSGAQ